MNEFELEVLTLRELQDEWLGDNIKGQNNAYSVIPFLLKKRTSQHPKNKTMSLCIYRYKCTCTFRERSGTTHIRIITAITSMETGAAVGTGERTLFVWSVLFECFQQECIPILYVSLKINENVSKKTKGASGCISTKIPKCLQGLSPSAGIRVFLIFSCLLICIFKFSTKNMHVFVIRGKKLK